METTRHEVYAVLKRGELSVDITVRTTGIEHAKMAIDALKELDGVLSIHLRTIWAQSTLAYEAL